jgi:hypothetical protein
LLLLCGSESRLGGLLSTGLGIVRVEFIGGVKGGFVEVQVVETRRDTEMGRARRRGSRAVGVV